MFHPQCIDKFRKYKKFLWKNNILFDVTLFKSYSPFLEWHFITIQRNNERKKQIQRLKKSWNECFLENWFFIAINYPQTIVKQKKVTKFPFTLLHKPGRKVAGDIKIWRYFVVCKSVTRLWLVFSQTLCSGGNFFKQ